MKKVIVAVVLLCLPPAQATQGGKFGAGFRLGAPTGFDFKYRLNPVNSVNFALGWNSYNVGN